MQFRFFLCQFALILSFESFNLQDSKWLGTFEDKMMYEFTATLMDDVFPFLMYNKLLVIYVDCMLRANGCM